MDKKEYCRQVFFAFKEMCASGAQDRSFSDFCRDHGLDHSQVRTCLAGEFQSVKKLPGYKRSHALGLKCQDVYESFKRLCAEGSQPSTFAAYYRSYGITKKQMRGYMHRNGITVVGLPGYTCQSDPTRSRCEQVPFEDVIFEEAGFLPADNGSVITVKVDGHVAVSFPADTDVDVIAKFIKKMGKEAGHVGS